MSDLTLSDRASLQPPSIKRLAVNKNGDTSANRLVRATAIIDRFSSRHIKIDIGIGVVGIIPGMGIAALLGAIGIQGPIIYQPMVREIGRLYEHGPDEALRRMEDGGGLVGGAADLAAEFGVAFMKESAREVITDQGIGFALAWIPLVGGLVAAGLDAIIARKVTRLVGAMAVIYYENPAGWLASRRNTRAVVRAAFKTSPAATVPEIVQQILRAQGIGREEQHRIAEGGQVSVESSPVAATATIADGAATGFATATSVDDIDPFVLDALERWRGIDPHTISAIQDAFTTKAGVFADAGLMGTVKGYTGEEVASTELHVPLPDDPMVPGWDLPHEGQHWQVKVGSTAYERAEAALGKNPEYPIISDPSTASRLTVEGHQAIGINDLDNDHLTQITAQTAVSIQDLSHIEPGLPIFSSMVITIGELRRCQRGELSWSEASRNVALRVGSREAAMLLMTTLAIGVAAAAGTLPVAGPFVAGAGLVGALGGREIAARLLHLRIPATVASGLVSSLKAVASNAAPQPTGAMP